MAADRERPGPAVCRFELFGTARLAAGVRFVAVEIGEPTGLRSVIPLLLEACPALDGSVVDAGRCTLAPGYLLNRGGRAFLSDPDALIRPGDDLLILSTAAGG